MSNEVRRAKMRQAMEAQKLDALILRLPENVLLLSGHWPMIGVVFLLFPREGKTTLIFPECYRQEVMANFEDCDPVSYLLGGAHHPPMFSAVGNLLRGRILPSWKRIGYEGNFETAAPSWNAGEAIIPAADSIALYKEVFAGTELVDATELILSERIRKTPYEIERMKIASEISCFGMAAFEELVKVGISGVELAAIVEKTIMIEGTGYRDAFRVRAFAQVSTGDAETHVSHRPNIVSTKRPMADGDFAVLELGVVADGYWADRTRVRIAGTARDEQVRIYETVRKAQEAATSAIKPGVRAKDVDAAARNVIEAAGYGPDFPHITGHGLGFGYHEPGPILGPHSEDVLEEGMLTSVEPGIYTAKFGGVRIEDDVAVTSSGSLVLGPYRKVCN
jgi:Xaa-Pro aminopeptidase